MINKFSDDNQVTVMDLTNFFQVEYITWMKKVLQTLNTTSHPICDDSCDDDLPSVETSEGDYVLVSFTGKKKFFLMLDLLRI